MEKFFAVENIIYLLYFFVPGFLSLQVYQLLIADSKTDYSKNLYKAIGISLCYFILIPLPIKCMLEVNNNKTFSFLHYLINLIFLFVIPILTTFLFCNIIKSNSKNLRLFIHPNKTPWDRLFSKQKACFMIVTLKNGIKIAGRYGGNSITSAYPRAKEIYLEETLLLDENNSFKRSDFPNNGVLITGEEILTIELFYSEN